MDELLVGNAVEDQWVDRLSHDVQALIASDNREARLHLRPRELGDLSIKLEMQDGQAKVRSEEHTSELQSLMRISYAVFCLKKKKQKNETVQLAHNISRI